MFMTDINQEKCGRYTSQLGYPAKYFFHFILITSQSEAFFLCNAVESSVRQHFFNALHFLHAFTNRVEIGEHTTQPAFCNEWHGYSFCTLGNDFLCLLFSADKHDLFTG